MRWQDDLQFYSMHFMPYVHLPPDQEKHDSLWVDFSNKHYDPEKGHELYQRYFREMVLADELGYDGLVVNEHHNTVYSMMPVCTAAAAALIPMTGAPRSASSACRSTSSSPTGWPRSTRCSTSCRGTARDRLSARDRHGVLEQLGRQPRERPREIPRIDRHHDPGLDAGRTDHVTTASSTTIAISTSGPARINGRIPGVTSSAPAARRRLPLPPSADGVTHRCSCRSRNR